MNQWLDHLAAPQRDLRNSANIVIGFSSVLQETEPLTLNQAGYIGWITRAAKTMAQRIEKAPTPSTLASPGHATNRGIAPK